jgi:signal transduction histidine kinase
MPDLSMLERALLLGVCGADHAILNAALHVVAAGNSLPRLLGVEATSLIGRSMLDVLAEQAAVGPHADLAIAATAALREVRGSGKAQTTPVFALDAEALEIYPSPQATRLVRLVYVPVFGAAGELLFIVQRAHDVTQLLALARDSEDHGATRARALSELRHELEARAQEQMTEHERANEELLREIAEHMKTEKTLRRTQEQLHHAQRLEAVGRLAGGIAHDFNNLLSIVLGYSTSLIAELALDAPMRSDIEEIRRAGERAAELTHQLLAFGRRQVLEPKVLDLNEVVLNTGRMIRRILGENIELVVVPAPGLWRVKVDPGQVEQVIVNLVINARDAMPEGGTLTIESSNVEFDGDYAQTNFGATPGRHVVLTISDTGFGMTRETQARIFEPFFTTKEKGKGTGLGLSSVFGIVKQSGGHIWLYSEPSKGTTFKLCFPCTAEATEPNVLARLTETGPAPRGTETILLVEDDAQLRTVARTILERHGYQVLDAPNGTEALVLSASFSGYIALLVTDVVMPCLNGRELARSLLEARPNTKVMYMSGYTDDAIVHNGILDPGVAFLQKPITSAALARKVRQVLDSP